MSPLIHILLYLVLFISLYIHSKNKYKLKNESLFWIASIGVIILFTIIEGCRYGRGADYLSYKYRFENIDIFEPQKLYLAINEFLHFLNADFVGAFMTYSLIFIVGTFYFIRHTFDRGYTKWMYLFAILAMLYKFESFPKQYLGLPFILCSIPYMFEKRKWWYAFIFILLGLNIHSGLTFLVLALISTFILLKKTLPLKYWLIALIVVYYILPPGFLSSIFTSALQMLNLDSFLLSDHITHYVENSDRWLGEDSVIESAQQTFVTKTLQFLFNASVIISTLKALQIKYDPKIMCFFNITAIGFIFCRAFHGYEIFARLFGQLDIFWFIPLCYSLYVYSHSSLQKKEKKLMKACLICAIAYQVMFYGRFIFLNPGAMYVWDL